MGSRIKQLAVCGAAGFFFLWLLIISYGAGISTPSRVVGRHAAQPRHASRSAPDDAWRDTIKLGIAHQNPALAPAPPLSPADLGMDLSLYDANLTTRQLDKPNTGPLYCTDGPCVDDSCCGPKGICGYGPDFCEAGCTSNCDATAMCGEYSEDANMPCGMKLCCSATGWCGTTDVYCHNADPLHGTLPCQAGYGSCSITGPPSCPQGSGSSKGRTIGYYQSWNARTRVCNKVLPKQLNTDGYTHLFFSFAFINPYNFQLEAAHPDDIDLMKEFTDLSKRGLKTWIAVGGFDFSNKEAATHLTWSQMVGSKENRAIFIASAKAFMDKHGFTGIDLDWEYPGAPERGGNKLADTRNLSLLVKEMRAAYGSNYGISLTLAPDYWYLRWFDAKAIEPYVDFLGFMAYDLHGSWDADVKALGKKVRGQADIREIQQNTIPLWFDGLNPSKLNFGLAMYGRGYTLADPSCSDLLCGFSGPSHPAPCTNFEGVMSLVEIKQLIKKRNLVPKFLKESLMKQITWDDQWIGYDDEETFEAKRNFADGLCFGGTMIWSIDFQDTGSGGPEDDIDVVYLAPEVYDGEPAQCPGPCQFVLPPRALPSPTDISIPPYVTSLLVAPGTTTTITVTIPVIKTESMDYYNVNVTSGQGQFSFRPTPSISIRPVTTTLTLSGGQTQVRTITLPPWPAITIGGNWPSPTEPTKPTDTTKPGGDDDELPLPPPYPSSDNEPPEPQYTDEPEDDDSEPDITWPPGMELEPVPTVVPEEGEDPKGDEKQKTTCKLWFFWVCISWGDLSINIQGWEWDLPVGVWGPGPPRIEWLKLPPGFTFKGTLPPWPQITVLPGGGIKPPPKPADCTPAEASLCFTTRRFATSVSNGQTLTTATSTTERCATITGCNFRDAATTKDSDVCTLNRRVAAEATALPEITGVPEASATTEDESSLIRRADEPQWCKERSGEDYILLMRDGTNAAHATFIRDVLTRRETELGRRGMNGKFYEVGSNALGYTAFFYVYNSGRLAKDFFRSRDNKDMVRYYYRSGHQSKQSAKRDVDETSRSGKEQDDTIQEGTTHSRDVATPEMNSVNDTNSEPTSRLVKRGFKTEVNGNWHLSQVSFPPYAEWDARFELGGAENHEPAKNNYAYFYDEDSLGEGQKFYMIEAGWLENVEEYQGVRRSTPLKGGPWGEQPASRYEDDRHGYHVGSYGVGKTVGIARKAELILAQISAKNFGDGALEKIIEILTKIADDIGTGNSAKDKSVVNMSLSDKGAMTDRRRFCGYAMQQLMKQMEARQGVVFVAAAGNDQEEVSGWPPLAAAGLDGMLVVGATAKDGSRAKFSNFGNLVNAWAPGEDLPKPPNGFNFAEPKGTSFAAPMVAGLVAYLRSSPHYNGDRSPKGMRAAIMGSYSRRLTLANGESKYPIIWNGQWSDDSCQTLKRDVTHVGRQLSCPLPGGPGSGGPGSGSPGSPPSITYRPGPNGPICKSDCGKLCSGFYCVPSPSGTPPDFEPPAPKPTTTAGNGNGNNDNGGGGFPTIRPQPDPTAPPGEVCLSSTTIRECNGGPHGGACIVKTQCASFGQPQPTHLPGLPELSEITGPSSVSGASCIKSTTWTVTGGPHGDATATSSGCALWEHPAPTNAPTNVPTNVPAPQPDRPCIMMRVFQHFCMFPNPIIRVQVWKDGKFLCDDGDGKSHMASDFVAEFTCKGPTGDGSHVLGGAEASRAEYTGTDGWKAPMVRELWRRDVFDCPGPRGRGIHFETIWYSSGSCSKCRLPVQTWNAQYGGPFESWDLKCDGT